MSLKYYYCGDCKSIVEKIVDGAFPCNENILDEIVPNSTTASTEKHIPEYEIRDNIVYVNVGSITHPMDEDHYIQFISMSSKMSHQVVKLFPHDEPKAIFALAPGDEVLSVYAYCNIHGLWVK